LINNDEAVKLYSKLHLLLSSSCKLSLLDELKNTCGCKIKSWKKKYENDKRTKKTCLVCQWTMVTGWLSITCITTLFRFSPLLKYSASDAASRQGGTILSLLAGPLALIIKNSLTRGVNYRPDPIWSEDKWVGYEFNFFDPNQIGSGSGQPDPTRLIMIFKIILWFSTN
jgi:hypothetical protein